jgi:hypothetical protein
VLVNLYKTYMNTSSAISSSAASGAPLVQRMSSDPQALLPVACQEQRPQPALAKSESDHANGVRPLEVVDKALRNFCGWAAGWRQFIQRKGSV